MEIIVNQDIRKFKTKDLGPFNWKEVSFICIAAAIAYAGYFIEKNVMGMEEVELAPIILVAAIPLLFGFAKPQGMTFLEFLKTAVRENMLDPKIYYWESDFVPNLDEFGDIYGEDYALTEERLEQIKMVDAVEHNSAPVKRSKEDIKREKDLIIM